MQLIAKNFQSQKSSSRESDPKIKPEHSKSKRSLLVGLQSDDENISTQDERVTTAVSDVSKTPTDKERRVDDVTTRTSRLELKHDDTDRKIKDVSSKMAQQKETLEKRVRELENEMTKEKKVRIKERKTLKQRLKQLEEEQDTMKKRTAVEKDVSSEARAALQARMETEVSDLKAKIRQVASEHTVMLLSPKIVKQPHAVHMGESHLPLSHVSLYINQCVDE